MKNRLEFRKIRGIVICMCAFILAGCGRNEELDKYQEDMSTFFQHIAEYNDGMNAIDASADDAVDTLLGYLDQLRDEIQWMAELEVPEQFSAVEDLADEADENMQQAVELYHQAYGSELFNEGVAQAAKEYYDRANIRIQYIITILHGEIPEGEGVTYTEENSILGGGYLNKPDEEEGDNAGAGDDGSGEILPDDNFDTDDTEFYVDPSEQTP